jgi:hypothetical protein
MKIETGQPEGRRWLFGLALVFTLTLLSTGVIFRNGRLDQIVLLTGDYPSAAAIWFAVGLSLWAGYTVSCR